MDIYTRLDILFNGLIGTTVFVAAVGSIIVIYVINCHYCGSCPEKYEMGVGGLFVVFIVAAVLIILSLN
ncbi:MAG: hypothetical protein IJ833_06905 [Lachnospiraceae bacterium]|nr:hypothetical protein [Lachnospiraceae bacterium]